VCCRGFLVSVVEHIATPIRWEAAMAAKKAKRASSKVKAVPNELTLPLEKPGEIVVDAARRLWLSAQSLATSPGVTRRESSGKGKVSR
jgi:hypothetical protein